MRRWLRDRAIQTLGGMLRPWFAGVGCILSFHRVVASEERSPLRSNRSFEITPGGLHAILDWVRRHGFDVIRLDELRNRLGEPRGSKFVCFTFDDGYRDNLTRALPIFREFGYPFAVNVTTGFIDRQYSLWWYLVEDLLARTSSLEFDWAGTDYSFRWGSPGEREWVFDQLATLIRAQEKRNRDALVAMLADSAGLDPLARTRELMMDWDELIALSRNWHVTIGAHTVGHHVLTRLSRTELADELSESRRTLEARLDKQVRHFAYPFGGRDAAGQREFEASLEADFETAVTTRCANLFKEHAWHLMSLPRLGMDGNYPALLLLERLENGLVPARGNGWKRVVTV